MRTGTSALHFLSRADDEGTVHVEIPTEDAEDGVTVLKLDNWILRGGVSIRGNLDIPAFWAHTGRAALVVE